MRFDNNAYTITSTCHGSTGTLVVYTTHPTQSDDPQNPIEHRMTQINGWYMTGAPNNFREGAGALRNARDWYNGTLERIPCSREPGPQSPGDSLVSQYLRIDMQGLPSGSFRWRTQGTESYDLQMYEQNGNCSSALFKRLAC